MKEDAAKESIQRIVEAATAEFAEVGYAGARIDAIAKRAGLNKAAIYYHIGGKRDLYEHVLHTLASRAVERVIRDIQDASSPEEQLRRYIRNLAQQIEQHPAIAPIVLREMTVSGQNLSEAFFQSLFRMVGTLTQILDEGERQGIFVPTIPLVIHFMTIGTLLLATIRKTLLAKNPQLTEILNLAEKQTSGPMIHDLQRLMAKLNEHPIGHPQYDIADEIEQLILKAVKRET